MEQNEGADDASHALLVRAPNRSRFLSNRANMAALSVQSNDNDFEKLAQDCDVLFGLSFFDNAYFDKF